jgi:integrase
LHYYVDISLILLAYTVWCVSFVFALFHRLPPKSVAPLLPRATPRGQALGADMSKKVLTDRAVRALKPAAPGRRDMHWDAALPSFGVRVTDRGAASFIVMRRLHGKLVRRVIGQSWAVPLREPAEPYPLAKARDEARRALEDLRSGLDPKAKRAAEAQEAERHAESAFGAVAERFIADYVLKRVRREGHEVAKMKSGPEVAAAIRRELKPLWTKQLAEITPEDVTDILQRIAEDRPYAAHHVLAYARRLFNWAIAQKRYRITLSPCHRLSPKDLIGERPPRQRILADAELVTIWRATAPEGKLGPPLAPFVRMLLLSGQRLREVGEAKWAEFDLDAALWTIPGARMKGDAAHEVPLGPVVVDLLKALPRGSGPFVFSTTDGRRPISGFSKLKLRLDRTLGDMSPWRFHDLRRSMRTGLGGLPVPTNVAELVIAHSQPGMHKIYDLHAYREEKRRALMLWADALLAIVEPPNPVEPAGDDNIVQFPARA